jgi:DNA invertase Pin-like site-specific DNA recombinase
MTTYGYARISTPKQSIERQISNLRNFDPAITIVRETYSGRVSERPRWKWLLARVRPGDTIVFDSVSRMSRDADAGVRDYFALDKAGVNLVFLKERHIDTATYRTETEKVVGNVTRTGNEAVDTLMQSILDALATYTRSLAERQIRQAFERSQKEVDDLRETTREGLREAKAKGRILGTRPGSTRITAKEKNAKPLIKANAKRYGGNLSVDQCVRLCGISRNTYFQYCREIDAETVESIKEEGSLAENVGGDVR